MTELIEKEIEFDMMDLMGKLVLKPRIIGKRRWFVRMWIGLRLMIAAAWVMGCKIEMQEPEFDE